MTKNPIQALLEGSVKNHMLPFLWLHGEDEPTLRHMMAVIDGANCKEVCVESRPHPDFCGPKWWADMDVILEEARQRHMRVWILDDKHYPTGYANGAGLHAPVRLCRQNIFCRQQTFGPAPGLLTLNLREAGLMDCPGPTQEELRLGYRPGPPERVFDASTDRILTVQGITSTKAVDLTAFVEGETICWNKPEGEFTLQVVTASHNTGFHRGYINMTDPDSVRLLLDHVYEPHWQHYGADFGKTIAGFFSDEPNLGNGPVYTKGNVLGCGQDLPWSAPLEQAFAKAFGPGWQSALPRLFAQDSEEETSRAHMLYMDCLTKLVRANFSQQVAHWCHEHGVRYIGHIIEDDGQHCRTGSSLGHFFRGLQGQDMAGIDDIGGQVQPQGEDLPTVNFKGRPRSGVFYHYGLGSLAASSAAIEPEKHGNAMCEIFGNYGWCEGVRLEKYLADHFLVRGINYFVPHAFTAKEFPDPDCPPHFYAQGHNPQYRHFGELMAYMNRVADITSSGRHHVPVAILYHGESEWCDPDAMPFEQALRPLYDDQINCHVVPADIFSEPDRYHTELGNPLNVNGNLYRAFVVPGSTRIPAAAAYGLEHLMQLGLPIFFAGKRPQALCEGGPLPSALLVCPVLEPSSLPHAIRSAGVTAPVLSPKNPRLRLLHVKGNPACVVASNEGATVYLGEVTFPGLEGPCYWYDPWANTCQPAVFSSNAGDLTVHFQMKPLKLRVLVFGTAPSPLETPLEPGNEIPLTGWVRATCQSREYPVFGPAVNVHLPDNLAEEQPAFSGFVRYDTEFYLDASGPLLLSIADAKEGVEVFLNGKSAGIQIAPPFSYKLEGKYGKNTLRIEVATTLERQCYSTQNSTPQTPSPLPTGGSGITGVVKLFHGVAKSPSTTANFSK